MDLEMESKESKKMSYQYNIITTPREGPPNTGLNNVLHSQDSAPLTNYDITIIRESPVKQTSKLSKSKIARIDFST